MFLIFVDLSQRKKFPHGELFQNYGSSQNIINLEIFEHKNVHVLNVCVHKFSWVPHEIFQNKNFRVRQTIYSACIDDDHKQLISYIVYQRL